MVNRSVPPDALPIDALHSSNAFCSGWVCGAQEEILRSKVLSCADAGAEPANITKQAEARSAIWARIDSIKIPPETACFVAADHRHCSQEIGRANCLFRIGRSDPLRS